MRKSASRVCWLAASISCNFLFICIRITVVYTLFEGMTAKPHKSDITNQIRYFYRDQSLSRSKSLPRFIIWRDAQIGFDRTTTAPVRESSGGGKTILTQISFIPLDRRHPSKRATAIPSPEGGFLILDRIKTLLGLLGLRVTLNSLPQRFTSVTTKAHKNAQF